MSFKYSIVLLIFCLLVQCKTKRRGLKTQNMTAPNCPWRQETVLTTLAFLWCVYSPWLQDPAWVDRRSCWDEALLGCLLLYQPTPPASFMARTLTYMELILGEETALPVTGLLRRPGFSKRMGLVFRFVHMRDLGEEAPWTWPTQATVGVTFKKHGSRATDKLIGLVQMWPWRWKMFPNPWELWDFWAKLSLCVTAMEICSHGPKNLVVYIKGVPSPPS